ncbi:uncharacterized protein METZ01_LOCUS516682, partial [marine metagenome]
LQVFNRWGGLIHDQSLNQSVFINQSYF